MKSDSMQVTVVTKTESLKRGLVDIWPDALSHSATSSNGGGRKDAHHHNGLLNILLQILEILQVTLYFFYYQLNKQKID